MNIFRSMQWIICYYEFQYNRCYFFHRIWGYFCFVALLFHRMAYVSNRYSVFFLCNPFDISPFLVAHSFGYIFIQSWKGDDTWNLWLMRNAIQIFMDLMENPRKMQLYWLWSLTELKLISKWNINTMVFYVLCERV